MCFGCIAPVHSGAIVMYRMIAIIKKQLVQKTDEVAGVVHLRFFIGMNMLNKVEDEYRKESHLLWYNDVEKRFLPIDDRSRSDPHSKQGILGETKPEVTTIFRPLRLQVISDRLLLIIAGNRWIRQQHRKMILLGKAVCDRVIALAVV